MENFTGLILLLLYMARPEINTQRYRTEIQSYVNFSIYALHPSLLPSSEMNKSRKKLIVDDSRYVIVDKSNINLSNSWRIMEFICVLFH
jgi:hypothetical protein